MKIMLSARAGGWMTGGGVGVFSLAQSSGGRSAVAAATVVAAPLRNSRRFISDGEEVKYGKDATAYYAAGAPVDPPIIYSFLRRAWR
jgi:hypothetical protein